jgi:hypothetical protein
VCARAQPREGINEGTGGVARRARRDGRNGIYRRHPDWKIRCAGLDLHRIVHIGPDRADTLSHRSGVDCANVRIDRIFYVLVLRSGMHT